MADDTLARIDEHMQRGNELLARIDEHLERGITDFSPEHLARGAQFAARLEAHMERCEEVIAGNAGPTRTGASRCARTACATSASSARSRSRWPATPRASSATRQAWSDTATERHTDEVIAEQRAQREALWRMLDKLDGKGGPEPAPG